jgi:hypothetical protein
MLTILIIVVVVLLLGGGGGYYGYNTYGGAGVGGALRLGGARPTRSMAFRRLCGCPGP